MNPSALPRVSPNAVKFFAAYSRRYMRRRFHAIRILKCGQPQRGISRPLVIYLNHASWWDPLVCLYLSRRWFSDRTSFAPIDAASLQRYGIFRSIGIFGVEQQSIRGAMSFLRTAIAILGAGRNVVWLTPQGRFMDVRERPLRLRGGIGALAIRMKEVEFLPLAIEYSFWMEPQPEILVSFGESIVPGREPGGWVISMIIGVLGSFVGAMVGRALGMYREGETAGFLMALAGAILLTFGYQAIAHRRDLMRH